MEILNVYNGYKPLCYIDKNNVLVYKKLRLYKFNLEHDDFTYIATLDHSIKKYIGCNIRILERILRLEPRAAIKEKNYILISFKGFIYKLNMDNFEVSKVHKFRSGMSNVLGFSRISRLKGFNNGIYYGEYLSNDAKDEVSIYRYDEDKDVFLKVYTFEKGKINHIHQIVEDRYRNRIWIMTGDFKESAAIWYTDNNFKTVELFLGGKQAYRACKCFATEDGLIYATDTPLEENTIRKIQINDTINEYVIDDIDGSVIYGTEMEDRYIISTTVEGKTYKNKLIKSLLTYKRGNGIKNWNVNLISILKSNNEVSTIKKFKKDIYPMGLCQFGAIQFIENEFEKDICICYGNSISKFDGKMMIIK